MILEPEGNVADVGRLMANIGPAARIILALNGGPEDTEAIGRAIEQGIARYAVGDAVRIPAVINLFTARAALGSILRENKGGARLVAARPKEGGAGRNAPPA